MSVEDLVKYTMTDEVPCAQSSIQQQIEACDDVELCKKLILEGYPDLDVSKLKMEVKITKIVSLALISLFAFDYSALLNDLVVGTEFSVIAMLLNDVTIEGEYGVG